ncbi:MAG TPA: hypothetical protein VF386_10120, partial [Usitatibacter sp.]
TVDAKGIFQGKGKITQVQKAGDVITFRFSGWITSGYASAPDSDPKRRWHSLRWDAVDVSVTLGDWTQLHEPERKDERPEVDAVLASLRDLSERGRPVIFSVDNPGLHFSSKGQLTRVSGTRIHASDARP